MSLVPMQQDKRIGVEFPISVTPTASGALYFGQVEITSYVPVNAKKVLVGYVTSNGRAPSSIMFATYDNKTYFNLWTVAGVLYEGTGYIEYEL